MTPATNDQQAAQIRSLSFLLLNLLNTRDFENPVILRQILPSIELDVKLDHAVGSSRSNGLMALFESVTTQHPKIRCKIVNMTASVEARTLTATTCAVLDCYGLHDGTRREVLCEMSWQRQGSEWICTKYRGTCYMNVNVF